MMNVIVSDKLSNNFSNYVVAENFESLLDKASDISFIILHHSSEEDISAGMNISKLHDAGVKILTYICAEPSPVLKMSIVALGGTYQEDEFYFQDEGELDFLIGELLGDAITNVPAVYTSMSIITDFVQAFMRKDRKINTEFYLQTVQQAINEVAEQTKQSELAMQDMSNSAINIFSRIVEILDNMKKSKHDLEQKFAEIETTISHGDASRNKHSAISIFPPVAYIGSAKVLSICEVSPCRYLTSFMLAYYNYLHVTCNKRVKLIFIHQKSRRLTIKYNSKSGNFVRIMPETLLNTELLKSPIVVTDSPKADVIKKLTHMEDEVVLIVDRLYNDPIIKGQVKTLYAVSGATDLSRFGLKLDSTIFTEVNYDNCFLCIPHIRGYSNVESSRQAQYFQACKDKFLKLNSLLSI